VKTQNPVAQIIVTRTLQTGGAALLALAGLRVVLPPERFRPLAGAGGLLVAGGLSAYFVATFTPRMRLGGAPLVCRLPPEAGNVVALTFDDGPHPETTPRLLDVLAQHHARATFFLVGENATRFPGLVRRIADAGHAVGIHGLRHETMVLQNPKRAAADLRAARRIIAGAAGFADSAAVRLFRPPYGFKTATLCRTAARLGLVTVTWSCDPRDYDPVSAGEVRTRLAARLRAGDIVLLHERPDARHTLDALPGVLTDIAARGLSCIALPSEPGSR
jgi:peptidoglycan/xylan/chitin deacetylase (PgdA/CDA1 family)